MNSRFLLSLWIFGVGGARSGLGAADREPRFTNVINTDGPLPQPFD